MSNIVDNTCNGQCSNCGECCTGILPLSNNEIDKIHKYIKKYHIERSYHNYQALDDYIDGRCPFRDDENKRCNIYEVRPNICRKFLCNQNLKFVYHQRDLIASTRKQVDMTGEFYGDYSVSRYVTKVRERLSELVKNKFLEEQSS